MEDVGICYGHLVHFTVICYILWTFGIVRGNLVYFSRFGIMYREKSGNPETNRRRRGRTSFRFFSILKIQQFEKKISSMKSLIFVLEN
jgi:hypothetical protein